ncbi:tyrosine-type recombinase/integrase [Microvirga vignae]|uniref:tyrosine-type recombinase/integrase n=1 Tax=Microvirga vignae TaxID=1225564 RepID=UPI000AEE3808|nr:tyrosine-type recombinase/integrase [Microvirga vignae]
MTRTLRDSCRERHATVSRICRDNWVGRISGRRSTPSTLRPTGSRDQAILLLLATTGIRSKKLRSLVLDDIRRRDAQVRVRHTKARSDRSVPLMREAGKTLADYILRARPDCGSRRVFLVHLPPVRPIDGSTNISRIARSALQRAGIALNGPIAAHLIRHSLATQLVSR